MLIEGEYKYDLDVITNFVDKAMFHGSYCNVTIQSTAVPFYTLQTVSQKLVHLLLNLCICRNIKTMEKFRNPVTIITSYDAPKYINNTVLILNPCDVKSNFTCGKWRENMTVDQCPPCTLSEDCDTVGVPSKYCDVFLHPEQSC
jgi:hypothetical protein